MVAANRQTDLIFGVPRLARELGLSVRWVREQHDAGVLPSLQCGRRTAFNLPAVRRAIAGRAAAHNIGDNPHAD